MCTTRLSYFFLGLCYLQRVSLATVFLGIVSVAAESACFWQFLGPQKQVSLLGLRHVCAEFASYCVH